MPKQSDQLKETLAQLKALGNEKVVERNIRNGCDEKQFGVQMGDLRKVAKKLKTNHAFALELWATENLDARLLAILIMEPKKLSATELDKMVRAAGFGQLADWLNAYIVRLHPEKESLREKWMQDAHPWAARAGWSLTSERIGKSPDGLDLPAMLDRIESELVDAPEPARWTMNFCLAGIGIHFPKLRKRALAIGEKLGVYRDFPCSKGCTSPFAPIWINEMVKRNGG
jgi:3-methyladenine DNA glycosylase AlkD